MKTILFLYLNIIVFIGSSQKYLLIREVSKNEISSPGSIINARQLVWK